jgi:hypothetical protein
MTLNSHSARASRTVVAIVVGVGALLAIVAANGPELFAQNVPVSEPVTFTRNIAPILQRSCQGCHHPEGLAPMALMTYEDVRPWARSIKARTGLGPRAGVMPPWFVDKSIGIQQYKNDPSLSAAEVAMVAKWVDSGAPQGDPADLPPARQFAEKEGWKIGTPDLIVEGPVVEMKATSPDWWGTVPGQVPSGLTEDRYVAAVQMREITDSVAGDARQTVGGRFIIHHMGFVAGAGDSPGDVSEGGFSPGVVSALHEVGRNEDVFDPEAGPLMKAGSKLTFGMTNHLHSNGRDTRAHLEIGFKFHPKGYRPTKTIRQMGLFGNSLNLDIKPMEANQKFSAYTVLQENAKILAFEPHMHAAGVRMCMDAIWGAGVAFETLSCVGYDHSWVRTYNFADDAMPLLPKGAILRITGSFDNTPSNKNVADPRNWSGLGHRSIDNMMNQLGPVQLLTDDEFQREMAQRRERLHLKPGDKVIGCPMCGTTRTPVPSTAANQ